MLDVLDRSELRRLIGPKCIIIIIATAIIIVHVCSTDHNIMIIQVLMHGDYVNLQMINLFRDPECKSVVITLHDEPAQGMLSTVTADNSNSTRSDVIDAMQKKIDEQDSYIKTLQLQLDSHAECGAIHVIPPMETEVANDTK